MIRTGDILLFHSPWWARLLMTYYHAGIAYVVGDRVSCIDASWRGVRFRGVRGKALVVRPKGATAQAGFTAAGWAMSLVGRERYSYRQAALILRRAFVEFCRRMLKLDRAQKLARALAVACSPLAVDSWRQAGVRFTPGAPEGAESPDDIAAGQVEFVGTLGGNDGGVT